MINALASFLGIHPALLIVLLVILFLVFAMFILNGGGIKYLFTGNARIDGEIRELTNFKFIKAMGELYKKVGEARARSKIDGSGSGWVIPVAIFIVVVVLSAIQILKASGVNFQPETKLVEKEYSCTRSDPTLRYLEVGEEIMVGDICNGKLIEPTVIPPTAAPTQTPTPLPVASPTVQVSASATPSTPIEQPSYLIKVVVLDGHPTDQGWMEVPSLDGYHQVDEVKCKVFDVEPLEIPAGTTLAFVLFEGGRGNWLISADKVNLSGTTLLATQDQVSLGMCKPGSWFSLWVK